MFQKQVEQKRCHDKRCKAREFLVGQRVLVRNVRDGPKWLPGEICNKSGPVSYEVNVDGQRWRRHAEQLLSLADNEHSQPDSQLSTELTEVSPTQETSVPQDPLPVVDNSDSPPVLDTEPETTSESENSPGSANSPEAELPVPAPAESSDAHTPRQPKTYPRRERRPRIRYEPTF